MLMLTRLHYLVPYILNLPSIFRNFKQIFYSTNPADIPLHIFDKQLKHIEDHYVWVESNFTDLTYVSHEDLIYDTDNITSNQLYNSVLIIIITDLIDN